MSPPLQLCGRRFGRLLVVEREGSTARGMAKWRCRCDCGSEAVVIGVNLRTGNTTSCGCIHREGVSCRSRTHGAKVKGRSQRTYRSWQAMKDRCLNPRHPRYAEWGGRGIMICPEWIGSYERFLADMGERPEGTTLDRLDSDGHYTAENCRWATPKEQCETRRPRRWKVRPSSS